MGLDNGLVNINIQFTLKMRQNVVKINLRFSKNQFLMV